MRPEFALEEALDALDGLLVPLAEARDRREQAATSMEAVAARARERALVQRAAALATLCEAAIAMPHGMSFDHLHPRDRLGKWMKRLDTRLREIVKAERSKAANRDAVFTLVNVGGGHHEPLPYYTADQYIAKYAKGMPSARPGRPDTLSPSFRRR